MTVRTTGIASILAVAAAVFAACGGGSSSPSSPSPTPTTPSLNACGVIGAPATTSIVNGQQCSPADTPVVKLNMRASDNSALASCTGTIIASRAILTAAHCVTGGAPTILVFLGVGDQLPAQSWVAHPDYQGSGTNSPDVAVIFMPSDLPRPPMPLLTSRDARVGETVVVAGWGVDAVNIAPTQGPRAGSTTLTAVESLFLQTRYNQSAASICPGDSGGPILAQENGVWAIAGVTSASSDVFCNTGTEYYVNVHNSAVSSFILGQVSGATQR
jgi:S1-C subfamily serine protease